MPRADIANPLPHGLQLNTKSTTESFCAQPCRQPLPISWSFLMVFITPISQRRTWRPREGKGPVQGEFSCPFVQKAFPYSTQPPHHFHVVVEDKHFRASTVIQGMTPAYGMEFYKQHHFLLFPVPIVIWPCFKKIEFYYQNKRTHKWLVDCACTLSKP